MERTHPHERQSIIQKFLNAVLHFASGLVRKRHRQNAIRFHIVMRNEVGNFISNAASLSRTGSSKDQHRAVNLLCSRRLFRVQLTI